MHPAAPLRNQFLYVMAFHHYWFSKCKDTHFSRIDKILSFWGVRSAVQHLAAVLGSAEATGADMSVVALQQVGISQMVFPGVVRHSHIYRRKKNPKWDKLPSF